MTRKLLDGAIIAPSDFSVIELENPPAWANVQFGTYDVETGQKLSDINSFGIGGLDGNVYAKGLSIGDGFSYECVNGFSLNCFSSGVSRKFVWFVDGEYKGEIETYGESGDTENVLTHKFNDNVKHEVTFVVSHNSCWFDKIYIDNTIIIDNPGVETYPEIEIEPIPTVKRYSALGKVQGDSSHPLTMKSFISPDPITYATLTSGTEDYENYSNIYFLDNGGVARASYSIGEYRCVIMYLRLDEEEMPHASSLIADLWAYGVGALTTNADFADGLDSWIFYLSSGGTSSGSANVVDGICEVAVITGGGSYGTVQLDQNLGMHPAGTQLRMKIKLKASKIPNASPILRLYDLTNSTPIHDQYLSNTDTDWKEYETQLIVSPVDANLRLYLYLGGTDDITYYIDYITIKAYGIDMLVYRDGQWRHVAEGVPAISPTKIRFDNLPGVDFYRPWDYIHDGIFPVLIKATYPSDGVLPSAVNIDYYEVETTSQYTKLSSNFLFNTVVNLLPPFSAWNIVPDIYIEDDYKMRIFYRGDTNYSNVLWVDLPANSNTTYSLDMIVENNAGRCNVRFYDKNSTQIDSIVLALGQKTFVTPPDTAFMRLRLYLGANYGASAGRSYTFKNPILTQTDTPQAFKPQRKYTLSTDTPITVTSGEIVSIDGTLIKSYKNSESVLESISQNSKDTGFKILQGINYLDFSISGGFAKVSVVDEGTNKVAAINEEYLPHMTKIEESAEDLAEYTQTPGGATRMDLIVLNGDIVKAGKKSWNIETPWIDVSEANRFINYLKSKHFVHVTFWLDEFGGGGKAVTALIRPSSIKVVREGARTYNLRKLTFTVEEG